MASTLVITSVVAGRPAATKRMDTLAGARMAGTTTAVSTPASRRPFNRPTVWNLSPVTTAVVRGPTRFATTTTVVHPRVNA